MAARTWAVAMVLVLSGCGTSEQGEDFDPLDSVEEGVRFAGANKFVVWQHNISWFSSAIEAETAIEHSVKAHPNAPDIFIFQECGKKCVCGETGVYNAKTGKCDSVNGPSVERALRGLNQGGKYTYRVNGLRVIGYRAKRFQQIGEDLLWGASRGGDGAFFAQCDTVEVGDQLSIMLEDTFATPPRQILTSATHWFVGRDCACRQVNALEHGWKSARVLDDATGARAGSYVDLHVITGDWNAQPDTELPTAYRVASATCDGLDLGGEGHASTGGPMWTFCQGAGGVSRPTTCTNKQAVDYIWARKYNGSGITWKGSPDLDANYSNDHRAVRTVFSY